MYPLCSRVLGTGGHHTHHTHELAVKWLSVELLELLISVTCLCSALCLCILARQSH